MSSQGKGFIPPVVLQPLEKHSKEITELSKTIDKFDNWAVDLEEEIAKHTTPALEEVEKKSVRQMTPVESAWLMCEYHRNYYQACKVVQEAREEAKSKKKSSFASGLTSNQLEDEAVALARAKLHDRLVLLKKDHPRKSDADDDKDEEVIRLRAQI